MRACLETLRIEAGEIKHLRYHQARVDATCEALGYAHHRLELSAPAIGLYRARVIYDDVVRSITYHPYVPPPPIRSLALVEADVEYRYKYADRSALDALPRYGCDDVLITQCGYVRDTSMANIALYDGDRWWTPAEPLLAGTTRARWIEEKKLEVARIHVEDLHGFSKVAILNALRGFAEVEHGIITPKEYGYVGRCD